MRGYLSRQGSVNPHFLNPALWKRVGLLSQAGQLPPSLLGHLLDGQDRDGMQLVRCNRPGGKSLHEVVLTLPCELSVLASKLPPEIGAALLRAMVEETMDYLQSGSVFVRIGKGGRIFRPAELLGLAFDHALNREGEPHLHTHLLIFPGAWDPTGECWRTVNLRQCAQDLHTVLRPRLMDAVLRICSGQGIQVIVSRWLAKDNQGPTGWTVTFKGEVIPAGSLTRRRPSSLMVKRVITDILDGPYPFQKDLKALGACRILHADLSRILGPESGSKATRRFSAFAMQHGLTWSRDVLEQEPCLRALDRTFALAEVALADFFSGLVPDVKGSDRPRKYRQHLSPFLDSGSTGRNTLEAEREWEDAKTAVLHRLQEPVVPKDLQPIERAAWRILKHLYSLASVPPESSVHSIPGLAHGFLDAKSLSTPDTTQIRSARKPEHTEVIWSSRGTRHKRSHLLEQQALHRRASNRQIKASVQAYLATVRSILGLSVEVAQHRGRSLDDLKREMNDRGLQLIQQTDATGTIQDLAVKHPLTGRTMTTSTLDPNYSLNNLIDKHNLGATHVGHPSHLPRQTGPGDPASQPGLGTTSKPSIADVDDRRPKITRHRCVEPARGSPGRDCRLGTSSRARCAVMVGRESSASWIPGGRTMESGRPSRSGATGRCGRPGARLCWMETTLPCRCIPARRSPTGSSIASG
ncbi:MAG: relaxase domain-containing protein [Chitinophagaceae bacterium]|nr:relaxase domain-containing protein [Chitinophagaceae bacterium]